MSEEKKLILEFTPSEIGMLLGLKLRADADSNPTQSAALDKLFSQVRSIEDDPLLKLRARVVSAIKFEAMPVPDADELLQRGYEINSAFGGYILAMNRVRNMIDEVKKGE